MKNEWLNKTYGYKIMHFRFNIDRTYCGKDTEDDIRITWNKERVDCEKCLEN